MVLLFQMIAAQPGEVLDDHAVDLPRPQLLLHVGEEHLRQGPLVEPLLQLEHLIGARLGVVHGFHRRGGGTQHQDGVLPAAAVFGDVSGVVEWDGL